MPTENLMRTVLAAALLVFFLLGAGIVLGHAIATKACLEDDDAE